MVYRHLEGGPRVFRQQRVRNMVAGSGVPQGHDTLQKVSKRKDCNRLPKRATISSRFSTSYIGDALVGRRRWDSPQVLTQVSAFWF